MHNISIQKLKKLVPSLFEKEHYIFHYKNLQLFFKLGMNLKKIRRVLMFDQFHWLKPCISFNTNK